MPPKRKRTRKKAPVVSLEPVFQSRPELQSCDDVVTRIEAKYYNSVQEMTDWLTEITETISEKLENDVRNETYEFTEPALPKTPAQKKKRLPARSRKRVSSSQDDATPPKIRRFTRSQSVASEKQHSPAKAAVDRPGPSNAVHQEVAEPPSPKVRYTRSKLRSALKQQGLTSAKKTPVQQPARNVITPPTRGLTNATPEKPHASGLRAQAASANKADRLPPSIKPPRAALTPTSSPASKTAAPSTQKTRGFLGRHIKHTNPVDAINSFVVRHTPDKKHKIEREREQKEKQEQQKQREELALQKKDELLRAKVEENRKKREERLQRVQAAQEQKRLAQDEARRKLEEKHGQTKAAEEAKKLRTPVESPARRSPRKQKRLESDSEQPEQKRAKPEPTRADKQKEMEAAEEKKRREKERIEREKEELRKNAERERLRQEEIRRLKEQEHKRVQEEIKLREAEAAKQRKLNAAMQKHNQKLSAQASAPVPPAPAKTAAPKLNSSQCHSYDMTPLREPTPSTATNYDIADLDSGDETDDCDDPRKQIPAWAQGATIKASLIQQLVMPPDFDQLFGGILLPDLSLLFTKHRKRFKQRTSSAIWDSPLWNPRAVV